MATDSSEGGNVQVEITSSGITITLQDQLAWKIERSWDEVSRIRIDTTEKNLFPSESGDNNLPITIKSGEIMIGDVGGDTSTSLSQYGEREVEEETEQPEEVQPEAERPKIPDYWKTVQEETDIQYDPSTEEVEFPEDKQLTDVFSNFVQFLFNNGYMAESDLPWTTPNARTNYVLNTEPVHKNDERMDAVEPVKGVFFDRKIPRVQRERHVKRLVEEFVKE